MRPYDSDTTIRECETETETSVVNCIKEQDAGETH